MSNKKKYLLLFVTVSVLVIAAAGFYMYNKPAVDVQQAAAKRIPAGELYATFVQDSVVAKKEYANQVVEVSGTVTRITENQQHQPVILLRTNTEGAAVNCTLEGAAKAINEGEEVSIKGICNGLGEGNEDLGIMADLYLVRCYHVIKD